jgi:hypothetical protein
MRLRRVRERSRSSRPLGSLARLRGQAVSFVKIYGRHESLELDVPPQGAVELDFWVARRMLELLREEGSFLGIALSGGAVLHVRVAGKGLLCVELVDGGGRRTLSQAADLGAAESALRAAYAGADVTAALER